LALIGEFHDGLQLQLMTLKTIQFIESSLEIFQRTKRARQHQVTHVKCSICFINFSHSKQIGKPT
jgi:hypothetical protein